MVSLGLSVLVLLLQWEVIDHLITTGGDVAALASIEFAAKAGFAIASGFVGGGVAKAMAKLAQRSKFLTGKTGLCVNIVVDSVVSLLTSNIEASVFDALGFKADDPDFKRSLATAILGNSIGGRIAKRFRKGSDIVSDTDARKTTKLLDIVEANIAKPGNNKTAEQLRVVYQKQLENDIASTTRGGAIGGGIGDVMYKIGEKLVE